MKNSNRPSYPIEEETTISQMGLTKREYFAGLATQGVMASRQPYKARMTAEHVASEAIGIAEELLKQLGE